MKIGIGILVVVLGASVYSLWPKASVEIPVVVSAQLNEENNTISISYITTKKDETYLMSAEVDGEIFYPAKNSDKENAESVPTKNLLSQQGYQLREDVIKLTENEIDHFDQMGHTLLVAISYKDYAPIETILIVLKENEAAQGVIKEDVLNYTFIAPEPMSITTIGHYDSVATLGYLQNDKEPKFPIQLEQGETIDIQFSPPYNLALNDELLLEIETVDGKYYRRHLKTTLNVPENYLKQLVP